MYAFDDVAAAVMGDAASFEDEMARLEKVSGGRLGVAVLDTASGREVGRRMEERFPMCSTHKWISAAAVLARVDRGQEQLGRVVRFTQKDVIAYSPATEKRVDAGISLRELCEAAVTLSDNTAANLLLAAIGGPAGWTAFVRTLGDDVTRLDRNEPGLNECAPGDPRDTTTPRASVRDLRAVLVGDALSTASKAQLIDWMVHNTTGDERLRAGLPKGWKVGDKTGTGANGTSNDVGIVWPAKRAPVLLAAYLTGATVDADARDRTLAGVGKAVMSFLHD
jgi:beta-lactamase class A